MTNEEEAIALLKLMGVENHHHLLGLMSSSYAPKPNFEIALHTLSLNNPALYKLISTTKFDSAVAALEYIKDVLNDG